MANPFDQFDEAAASSNPFDQFDNKTGPVPAIEAPSPENVARPRLSMSEEFVGGLKDALAGVTDPYNPAPEGAMNLIPRSLPNPGQVALGLLRTASFPLAPLYNRSTEAGEKVTDVTGSPVAGALTSAVGDVLLPAGIARMFKTASTLAKPFLSTSTAQVQKLETALASGEAGVNKAAQAAREAATLEAATQAHDVQIARLRQVGEARSSAVAEKAPYVAAQGAASAIAKGASTTETVGKKFLSETYPQKLAASKARFKTEYDDLVEAGKGIESDATHLKESVGLVLGEKGAVEALGSKAEKVAGATKAGLPLDEDQLYEAARNKFMADNPGLDPAKLGAQGQQVLKATVEDLASTQKPNPTLGDLIGDRQRLRAEMRAAYSVKNDSLGRQYGELEKGVLADIKAGDAAIADDLVATDAAYRTEHVPYFVKGSTVRELSDKSAESFVDRVIRPKTDANRVEKATRAFELITDPAERKAVGDAFVKSGIEEATKTGTFEKADLTKWWYRYTDPKTEDRVLKIALGENYQSTKSMIETFQSVDPISIDVKLGKAVDAINKRTASRLTSIDSEKVKRLGTLEGALDEGNMLKTPQVGTIEKNRTAQIDELKRSIETQTKAATGGKIMLRGLKFWGVFMMVQGTATANPIRIGEGVTIVLGGLALEKLMSNKAGNDLLRRGLKASMTSGEVQALAGQIQNVLRAVTPDDRPLATQ